PTNTMPPKSEVEATQREGRLICAINALQNQEIPSIKEASRLYHVNYDTLRCRLNGRPSRANTLPNSRNLDNDDEKTLTDWILDLAARGYPPRKWIVQDTANLL
ncbi:hypothetical protein BKA66DRAFT_375288, partial [Pyrenochaeta sp. MPI-SDFR-AT-0127]